MRHLSARLAAVFEKQLDHLQLLLGADREHGGLAPPADKVEGGEAVPAHQVDVLLVAGEDG